MKSNNSHIQQLTICKGLPASGKSTYAKKWVAEDPENRVMIEKDSIRKDARLFKDGVYKHKRGDERLVLKERDRLLHQAFKQGKSVISSDTNLAKKHVSTMSKIARRYGLKVKTKSFLDVPIAELIKRDSEREDSVGEQVIRRMFHTQVKKMDTFLEYDPDLPHAIICDLDGTLTTGPKDRSPYEWHKVGNDDINLGLAHALDGMRTIDLYDIFIFSGRNEVCRPETEEWLTRHNIEYDRLVMRPQFLEDGKTENSLSDEIIKSNMIEEHIRGKYNILIWFDDRVRISNMLRDVYGINVAQFGDPNFHF